MRKRFSAMRIAAAVVLVLVGLMAVAGAASGKGHGHKQKKCKGGRVTVTINGRARCTPLAKALPRPKETDQALVSVQQALGTEFKGLRDRHGRRVPSARGVLGAGGVKKLESAVKKGLTLSERLKSARASTLASVASPFATASGANCGPLAKQAPSQKFKSGGLEANVDLANGSIQMAVDGGANGLRIEFEMSSCPGRGGGLNIPGCPEADGRLDGTDENLLGISLRVFQGNELVFGQSFKFKARTVISPVQVDDNAKLEYFEIDHKYTEDASQSGITLHFVYHGHARVTYPGANYDPHNTDVEGRVSVAGVSDSEQELRDAEFDLGFAAKPKADKIFADEVEKVIKALGNAERNWMTPNTCAKITFTPTRNSLKPLKKAQKGSFQARVDSADGGTPTGANWSVLKQANGAFTPTTAHANPASFNYTVINVGNEVFIEATLKAVSAAGVAEYDWIQPTEPDEINHITGTFTVTSNLGGSIEAWSGEATYDRLTPGLSGAMGVYTLASGTATVVVSGYWGGGGTTCTWKGEKTYPIEKENAVSVLEVDPGSLKPPYTYNIEATVRDGDPSGIKVLGCEGTEDWEADMQMDLYTDPQVSDDGIHFKGSSTETPASGYTIEQTWDFEGVK
jgi:hypothetical protein